MIALSLLGIVLEFADPFERYLVAERLPEYSYPHGPQSVPTWTLPFLGIFIPLGIIVLVASSSPPRASSTTDEPTDPGSAEPPPASSPLFSSELRRASAGLCLSVALGFAVTNALKVSVGAFRPDFAARCWPPDGASPRWAAPGRPECAPSANPRAVAEGRKSFPSGHASMAFSGLAYASAYVATKLRVFDGSLATDPSRASTPRLLCALAPVALAAAVAVSRERDYWHHAEDARVGSAVGAVSAGIAWALKRPVATSRGSRFTRTHDAVGWAEEPAGRGPEGASAERRRRADDVPGRREERGRGGALGGGGARDDDAADDAGRRLYPSGDVSDSGDAGESLLPGTRRRGDSSGDADEHPLRA
jgi:membrane-associated phospholipid phosphatase